MGDFDTRKVLSRRHHHRSKFLKQKGLMGFEQKIEREREREEGELAWKKF